MNDFTFAARQLRTTPVFTIVAILSIALGIGANTAIFSLLDEFLLRSLPVRAPETLVMFRAVHAPQGRMSRRSEGPGRIDPATGRNSGTALPLAAADRFLKQTAVLSDVFAFAPMSEAHVLVEGVPETSVTVQFVSGRYYSGLGVGARIGRVIAPDDDRAAAAPVAVISHRYWVNRFDSDPAALGATIQINKVNATIVGVTPSGFDGAMQAGETADISVPIAHHAQFQPDRADRAQPWYWWVRVMARLAPGVSATQARAALEPTFQAAARDGWRAGQGGSDSGPVPGDPLLRVDPGGQGENDARRQHAGTLRILMGLVALVLIAACTNVANLLVARGDGRRREMALRLAIGASRWRIVRQLLIESLMLAFGGAALGLLLAWWGRDLLLALRPFGNTMVVLDLPLDSRVFAFTLIVAMATALVFGLAPALRTTRVNLTQEFQGGARALGGGAGGRLGQAFMALQVALSLVLLVSTGLFVRTVSALQNVEAGFNRRGLVLFRIDATSAGYSLDAAAGLHTRIQDRLAALPGATAATFSRTPLLSRTRENMTFTVVGEAPPAEPPAVNTNGLAPNFFSAMELAVIYGRGFEARDEAAASRVAVVNQAFARLFLHGGNPIGRELDFTAPNFRERVQIVGVAHDAKYTDLRSETPATVYFPAQQRPDGTANYAVRASGDPAALFAAIRSAVRDVDPTLPVLNLRTQDEQLDHLHGQERLFAHLSGFFGIATLVLACVGLYGLMSHRVSRRTGEIGVRLALGALPMQMLRMVVGESLIPVGVGIAIGVGAAYAVSRLIASMLFGVSATDPATYLGVALMLLLTAILAALLPAYRAGRVQPMAALRME